MFFCGPHHLSRVAAKLRRQPYYLHNSLALQYAHVQRPTLLKVTSPSFLGRWSCLTMPLLLRQMLTDKTKLCPNIASSAPNIPTMSVDFPWIILALETSDLCSDSSVVRAIVSKMRCPGSDPHLRCLNFSIPPSQCQCFLSSTGVLEWSD